MSEENENVIQIQESVEILQQESAISIITKAEIDTQILTAKSFPRSLSKFLKKTMEVATLNEDIAQSCAYALPRGGKTLEGPSVRLAEIAVSSYGNVRAGMRVIRNDGRQITAQGICHDLESNTCVTLEVTRSILQNVWVNGQKTGAMKTMSEDMQVVTGNAACAIAFRNAVFKIIPTALISDIYDKVKEVARGTQETLVKRRDKAMDFFIKMGVKDVQIFQVLEVKGIDDIDLDKLSVLSGMKTLIKNGENTLTDLFPAPEQADKGKVASKATEDAIKAAADKAKNNATK